MLQWHLLCVLARGLTLLDIQGAGVRCGIVQADPIQTLHSTCVHRCQLRMCMCTIAFEMHCDQSYAPEPLVYSHQRHMVQERGTGEGGRFKLGQKLSISAIFKHSLMYCFARHLAQSLVPVWDLYLNVQVRKTASKGEEVQKRLA